MDEKSASSSTRLIDLPPSSRKTGFTVAAAAAMIRRPVAVEPVKATMSTSGEVERTSPTRWSDDATMFTTPGGMSVFSAISRPRRVAFHGVSGAGLSTHVLPMARIGPSLLRMISTGKFHGTITPTTPIGSLPHLALGLLAHAEGVLGAERTGPGERLDLLGRPRERLSHGRVELRAVGEQDGAPRPRRRARRAAPPAPTGWRPAAGRGSLGGRRGRWPTSWCRRLGGPRRWRRACRRRVASATGPSTSRVAGLTLSKVPPVVLSTSLPSMSSRRSPMARNLPGSFGATARRGGSRRTAAGSPGSPATRPRRPPSRGRSSTCRARAPCTPRRSG